MCGWWLITLLGCGSSSARLDASLASKPRAVATPRAAGAGCAPPEGTPVSGADQDLDGDGVPELVTERYDELLFYRRDAACTTLLARLHTGPLAFVHVSPGMVSVETWLMHGDRRSVRYRYDQGQFVQVGAPREILGPRR